jgi:hypothetical protein
LLIGIIAQVSTSDAKKDVHADVDGIRNDGLMEPASLPDSTYIANEINPAITQKKSPTNDTNKSLETIKSNKPIKKRVYAEIVSGNDNEFTAPLRVFVHETLTSSAVDSIIDSQLLANELAKSLIIEVLQNKSNQGNLGQLLRYTFASPTVLCPTRDLVYWSLRSDQCFRNILWNTQWHRNYWLEESTFDRWQLDAHSGLVEEKQELDGYGGTNTYI